MIIIHLQIKALSKIKPSVSNISDYLDHNINDCAWGCIHLKTSKGSFDDSISGNHGSIENGTFSTWHLFRLSLRKKTKVYMWPNAPKDCSVNVPRQPCPSWQVIQFLFNQLQWHIISIIIPVSWSVISLILHFITSNTIYDILKSMEPLEFILHMLINLENTSELSSII